MWWERKKKENANENENENEKRGAKGKAAAFGHRGFKYRSVIPTGTKESFSTG